MISGFDPRGNFHPSTDRCLFIAHGFETDEVPSGRRKGHQWRAVNCYSHYCNHYTEWLVGWFSPEVSGKGLAGKTDWAVYYKQTPKKEGLELWLFLLDVHVWCLVRISNHSYYWDEFSRATVAQLDSAPRRYGVKDIRQQDVLSSIDGSRGRILLPNQSCRFWGLKTVADVMSLSCLGIVAIMVSHSARWLVSQWDHGFEWGNHHGFL